MKLENRNYYKLLTLTSLPVVAQNLLQNSLSFIDTLMIGRLGETEIAAVGLANQYYFLFTVVLFGITSGISIFTSQYWGSRNQDGMQKVMGLGFAVSVAFSSLFAAFSVFAPSLVLRIFVTDNDVIEVGKQYLQWVGISYIFTGVTQISSIALRSTGDTKRPMYVTLISMVIDVVGNYILIFIVRMGAKGAAIATLFARLVEMIVIGGLLFRSPVKPIWSKAFSFDMKFALKIFRTALPVILDDTMWALGLTAYKYIYSHMGIDVLASANVSNSILDLFFIVQNGIGAGAAILLGNQIGRGEYSRAKTETGLCLKANLWTGVLSGALLTLCSSVIPGFFNISRPVYEMTRLTLLLSSVTMPVKYLNHMIVCGVLRSGGDTKFMLFGEIFSMWAIGVPCVALAGLLWSWPIQYVILFSSVEELSKLLIFLPRVFSGKWINDLSRT